MSLQPLFLLVGFAIAFIFMVSGTATRVFECRPPDWMRDPDGIEASCFWSMFRHGFVGPNTTAGEVLLAAMYSPSASTTNEDGVAAPTLHAKAFVGSSAAADNEWLSTVIAPVNVRANDDDENVTTTTSSTEDPNATTVTEENTTTATEDPNATTTTEYPNATTTTEDPNATTTTEDPNATTATEDPNVTTTEDSNATTTEDPNATTTEDPNATTTEDPNATTTEDPNATTTEDPNATTTEDPNATTPTKETTTTTAAPQPPQPYVSVDVPLSEMPCKGLAGRLRAMAGLSITICLLTAAGLGASILLFLGNEHCGTKLHVSLVLFAVSVASLLLVIVQWSIGSNAYLTKFDANPRFIDGHNVATCPPYSLKDSPFGVVYASGWALPFVSTFLFAALAVVSYRVDRSGSGGFGGGGVGPNGYADLNSGWVAQQPQAQPLPHPTHHAQQSIAQQQQQAALAQLQYQQQVLLYQQQQQQYAAQLQQYSAVAQQQQQHQSQGTTRQSVASTVTSVASSTAVPNASQQQQYAALLAAEQQRQQRAAAAAIKAHPAADYSVQ